MKTVILVRHAKSSWEYSVSDRDRPLMERGIRDADKVAQEVQKKALKIDAAYSSPANRALHTAMIFLRALDVPFSKFELSDALYDFSGNEVRSFINSLDNDLETVIIFGHNEAFTHLANVMGNRYIGNVPTSGVVELKFDVGDWGSVEKGTTIRVLSPKEL